ATLVRAVRALDHGDAETIPDRLERVWDILEDYRGGNFHAAEEMLLRWLLKNMTGSSSTAERLRRYPRVWHILAAVFTLIPLFSLAKSLADRRFVGLLQQTLKDIAAPEQEQTDVNGHGPDSDVDMADAPSPGSPANPRKRKRPDTVGFHAASQRRLSGCLHTAEAVFDAVRILLSRCELQSLDGPATHRMGAEHVKSLFSTSAADAMSILVPWLTMCGLAVDGPDPVQLREQSSWLSTFAALWELRLQSAADASEVATHLSGTAARILGKLARHAGQTPLGVDAIIRERWTRDLRRFLTRNLILPARAIFLNKRSQEIVKVAVDMSSPSAQFSFPVLFDLVSNSPLEHGAKTSKKDHETWVQTVFDAILHAARNVNPENRTAAVRSVMELAAERGTALSISSLRAVCNDYALRKDEHDWSLLLAAIKLNPDVFLIADEGKRLLERVLERTKEPYSVAAGDWEKAARFIVLLADGYAQARDLSTFVRVWLDHLAPTKPGGVIQPLWAQDELAETVARLVQPSLTSAQLVDIIEWLASRTLQNETWAKIHILEALSNGISQEDFIDAVNIKIFEAAFAEKSSKSENPSISALRWTVASKAVARGTSQEADHVWSQIKSDLKNTLQKGHVDMVNTFTAFKCCVAVWLANHPSGPHEDDTASMICCFVERIQKTSEPTKLSSDGSKAPITKGAFSHLESIGRCLSKVHKRSNRRSRDKLPVDDGLGDRGNFRLLQQLTVLAIRQMTSGNPGEREKAYLREAISLLQSQCDDSDAAARIVLLQAFISTVQSSPAIRKLEEDGLNFNDLNSRLVQLASSTIASGKRSGKGLLVLLLALGALSDLDREAVRSAFSDSVPSLLEASNSLLEAGSRAGWELRTFVANHFPEVLESPLELKMPVEQSSPQGEGEESENVESAATLDKTALLQYLDAVVRSADEDAKLGYLKELLLRLGEGQDMIGRQLVVYRLIQHLKGKAAAPGSRPSDSPDRFDLAQAHSMLCDRLLQTSTPPSFYLTARAIRLILDQNPACMTQWNIELTLSTVSAISARPSTQALLSESPGIIYPALCRLVEMVIRRHRKRLDGHFHILLIALQSLLRLLLSQPDADADSRQQQQQQPHGSGGKQWKEKQAKLFARLLTLICEPTAASVTRSQQANTAAAGAGPLESERDKAKRYAGQFMYLVLMQYVKLQLEYVVPLGVREALEPGVYAIMGITTPDVLRIMNDGLDPGGRVVFKEMYKMYQRFGKWSGV
ncbi:hypothetical protein MYCTH_2060417, partial [Thermothelomyces thermophilus ATCC 42464]